MADQGPCRLHMLTLDLSSTGSGQTVPAGSISAQSRNACCALGKELMRLLGFYSAVQEG